MFLLHIGNEFFELSKRCKLALKVSVDGVVRALVSVYMHVLDQIPLNNLVSLVETCTGNQWDIVLWCDINSHLDVWGNLDTNTRGRNLVDYLVGTDLEILNSDMEPTFVTRRNRKIIDITLASLEPYR